MKFLAGLVFFLTALPLTGCDDGGNGSSGDDGGGDAGGDASGAMDGSSEDGGDEDASLGEQDVSLQFGVDVNGEAFDCGSTYAEVGTPSANYTITDARFYVYGIELLDGAGAAHPVTLDEDAFQSDGVALLDFEDGCGIDGTEAMHTAITGTVPEGDYEGIRFTLGVPPEKDFVDLVTAEAPLDVTGMYWIWQFGYKYLKVDGTTPVGEETEPFFIHLGAGGCPGDNFEAPPSGPCAYPNRVTYVLSDYSPADSTVVADLGAALEESDLATNTAETAPGCMSEPNDPECITLLPRLGVNGAADQVLFKVE